MEHSGLSAARTAAAGRLLERERELSELRAVVRAAADGDARVAFVEGPAGIGKTRLVAEARRLGSEAGMAVLSARGGELEREFAFGVVRQLFEPVLVSPEARERLFDGAAAPARVVFERLDDARVGAAGDDTSFAALHGLYWLTLNLSSERPLLLAVDDLHWCDRPSLRFLAYLVRRLEGTCLALVCSVRGSEPGTDTGLLAEIAADPLVTTLHPGTLTAEAVGELVRERLSARAGAEFAAACHAATGGNPLFVHELLKALAAEVGAERPDVRLVRDLGPRAASRTVLLRLARLDETAVKVAHAIALLGDGAELARVAALAGVEVARAADATGELARAEILRPEAPLGFVHTLVGAAVYRDLAPGERELGHERAARLLAEAGAPPEQTAAHLLAVPGRSDPWVVETLRRAAREALAKGAADSAVSYLARALDEPPAAPELGSVLFELGRAEALTSGPAAAEHLRGAYETLEDPVERARVAVLLARTLLFTGRAGEAAALAREAAAGLGAEELDLARRLDALRLSLAFFDAAAVPQARAELERRRDELLDDGAGAKMLAAIAAYHTAMEPGPADRCADLAARAVADGSLIEADNGGSPLIAAIIVLALSDRDEALETCDAALADAHRRGSVFAAAAAHVFRGITLARRGELDDAEAMLRAGLDGVRTWGTAAAPLYPGMSVPLRLAVASAALADVLVERGDAAGARAALARGGLPETPPENMQVGQWLASRLRVLVLEGRAEEALEAADDCARRFDSVFRNPAWMPWRSLKAQALHRLERTDEAVALAREELELARRWGAAGTVGRALRVLGTLEGEAGIERLREAVEVLEGSPARLEQAKALGALGKALRLARRPTEAREPLRRALELASICGASALCEELRAELQAAGVRPRTSALQGVAALTASERRVASLAAEGQTNRDIAQTLYVTPKTVEVHLSNAYRKLGIRSRRELAPALASSR